MPNDYLSEIRDVNLSYLTIVQQMIREDRTEAIFRLGISGEIADLIANMSDEQVQRMASCNVMLSRFRFNDTAILSTLLRDNKTRVAAATRVHASVVMES